MTDETRTKSLGQDLLGISLFAAAVFLGVSAVMAMLHGEPAGGANASTTAMGGLVLLVGGVPSLAIALGLALLGARQWVVGPSPRTLRHVVGVAGIAFGLAVLCGAAGLPFAGAVGDRIGGSVARTMSAPVGILVGLVLIAAPAWWAWIGPAGWIRATGTGNSGKNEGFHAALSRSEAEGVSAAEAEALLPERRISPEEAEELARALVQSESDTPPEPVELPPLYPPDVRREGKIPPGAKPLDLSDDRPTSSTERDARRAASAGAGPRPGGDPAVSAGRDLGALGGSQSAGADLADEPADVQAGGDHAPDVPTIDLRQRPRPAAASPAAPLAPETPRPPSAESPSASEPGEAPAAGGRSEPEPDAAPASEPGPAAPRPAATPIVESSEPFVERMRPSWEQPDLFVDESDSDPVETRLPPRGTTSDDSADDEEEEDPTLADVRAEDDEEEERDENGLWAEDEEDVYEDEDEYAEEEPDEALAEDDEGEDEEEYEDEEIYAEGDEEGDEEDEEDGDSEEEADEAWAEDEDSPGDELLEDEEEEAREVVLEPRAAPAASGVELGVEPDGAADLDEALVYRAGCLLLERNRVAVSLLQREFHLDFDGATRVLDRLQELGLIGPYLGGQKRDILMTPEAWREQVEVR